MPTSLATWRRESAARVLSPERSRAASRMARRGRSLRSTRDVGSAMPLRLARPPTSPRLSPGPPAHDTGTMSDHLSKSEIRKDAVQGTVEAAASTVGQVTTILTGAVRDVAAALGGF